MLRIDGAFLYKTGSEIHPLTEMKANDRFSQWHVPLLVARFSLDTLLNNSIFRLRTSRAVGTKLLRLLERFTTKPDPPKEFPETLSTYDVYEISDALTAFETVLNAELGLMDMYLVIKKRGYDTADLIENGLVLFPDDLPRKVPDVVADIQSATRCIAFELPTAAGFHLHRANESVLHKYYDVVTGGAARPKNPNMGEYLKELEQLDVGDAKVRSALKDLKNLHRNPLIHPEDSLESTDEAVALLGSIHAAIVHMLAAIPLPESVPAAIHPGA